MMTLDEVIIGIKEQMGLGDPILIDALHYLEEHKMNLTNHILIKERLKFLQDLWKEENEPLSWDELKQMEGRPVWLEDKDCYSRWKIISGVYDDGISLGDYFLSKNEFDTTWQAYRREKR